MVARLPWFRGAAQLRLGESTSGGDSLEADVGGRTRIPSYVQMHHNASANLAHRTTLASRDEALVSTRGIPALLVVVQGGSGRSRDVGSCSAVVGEVRLLAGSSRSSGQQARCQVPLVLAEEQCAGSVAPVVDVERWVPGGALRSAGEQERPSCTARHVLVLRTNSRGHGCWFP
jgi:hypothetical protein